MARPSFPNPFLPDPPDGYDRSWMSRFADSLRQQISKCLSAETAFESFFMRSPSGFVYKYSIDDDGNWVKTRIK